MSQSKLSFEDYEGFINKFKKSKKLHKMTTDDCYTPPEVMDVVNLYVAERWGLDPATFVRPFWPGGDYEAYDYPDGCTVVDNPPFSMLVKIQTFYLDHGIKFFLFAPTMTCINGGRYDEVDHVITDCRITYTNGAIVNTSFITNLDEDNILETEPVLTERLKECVRSLAGHQAKMHTAKWALPDEVLTTARASYYSANGVRLELTRHDAVRIRTLDSQRQAGKSIYGAGLLLSPSAAAERAAADRAAAERAAPHVWELSDREREMSRMIGEAAKAPRGA